MLSKPLPHIRERHEPSKLNVGTCSICKPFESRSQWTVTDEHGTDRPTLLTESPEGAQQILAAFLFDESADKHRDRLALPLRKAKEVNVNAIVVRDDLVLGIALVQQSCPDEVGNGDDKARPLHDICPAPQIFAATPTSTCLLVRDRRVLAMIGHDQGNPERVCKRECSRARLSNVRVHESWPELPQIPRQTPSHAQTPEQELLRTPGEATPVCGNHPIDGQGKPLTRCAPA